MVAVVKKGRTDGTILLRFQVAGKASQVTFKERCSPKLNVDTGFGATRCHDNMLVGVFGLNFIYIFVSKNLGFDPIELRP